MEKEQLTELFKKYHEGKCTEEEKALLESWYLAYNEHPSEVSARRITAIGKRVFRELPGNHHQFIRIGFRLAAAAAVIGVIITLTLKFALQGTPAQKLAKNITIPPGGNKATLTLANGQQINLSAAGKGQIARQAGISIYKSANGLVTYQAVSGTSGRDLTINTIATPKGGQWQLTLADGTRVWLNSASSLRFPATFSDQKERMVRLTGEGYFEVAKDKTHPFKVQTENQTVEVLGTHFNINAYDDEGATKTTLAEGKINVTGDNGRSKLLLPGQQAILTSNDLQWKAVDIDDELAWKNGSVRLTDQPIASIMRQLSRWYDIDVHYEGHIQYEGLNGRISRSKNLAQILEALEATGTVHFKVEGRRITVMK